MWLVFPCPAGFAMVDFPCGEGVLEGETHTQIEINNPPRILQLCGQVCVRILVEKVRSFFVFNCIEYGTSLLREHLL